MQDIINEKATVNADAEILLTKSARACGWQRYYLEEGELVGSHLPASEAAVMGSKADCRRRETHSDLSCSSPWQLAAGLTVKP